MVVEIRLTNTPRNIPMARPPNTTKKKEKNAIAMCSAWIVYNGCLDRHLKLIAYFEARNSEHGVVEDHRDTIIEERLTKHEEVEVGVNTDILEDREDSHRVN